MARTNYEQFKPSDDQSKWLNDKSKKTLVSKSDILRGLINDEIKREGKRK